MSYKLPPKEVQIHGLLTGLWPPEAQEFVNDPKTGYSVTRADISKYLAQNPQAAQDYLERWGQRAVVDIHAIWKEGGGYKVAWMARDGKPFDVEEFSDVTEAVVSHVCRQSGIHG